MRLGLPAFLFLSVIASAQMPASKVGIFRSGFYWLVDSNGNQQWDAPPDTAFAYGGIAGDIAVSGDWDGSGKTKIGIYRSSNSTLIRSAGT